MLVFWFWREIVFGVMYVLSVQYSCAVVSVFWLWQEIVLWREMRAVNPVEDDCFDALVYVSVYIVLQL
jgi:hypothetical protein